MYDLEHLRQRCIQAILYNQQVAKADSLCADLIGTLGYDPSEGQNMRPEERLLLLVNCVLTQCDTVPTPKTPRVPALKTPAEPQAAPKSEETPMRDVAPTVEETPVVEPKAAEVLVMPTAKKKGAKKSN